MNYPATRQPDRYHCVICGKKVKNAHQAFIREDRPFGARLCKQHAEIIAEHFADTMITTLKLALVRKRLRQEGYEVDATGYAQSQEDYDSKDAQEFLSKIFD